RDLQAGLRHDAGHGPIRGGPCARRARANRPPQAIAGRQPDMLSWNAQRAERAMIGEAHATRRRLPLLEVAVGHVVRLEAAKGWAAGDAHYVEDRKSTSELQSRENLVCRLLLEKKK